jgi:uncharacterized repeat protein (TIGR01451 family)
MKNFLLSIMLCLAPIFLHSQIDLGSAATFGVLGASTVTNTGFTVITGNLGVSPGTAITGFPPGIVTGGEFTDSNPVAVTAQSDALIAYNTAASLPLTEVLTGQDLGGLTLGPGVYFFASSAQLTGTLTLDAQGNPNAIFVFQIGSTLTTATGSAVVMINGGVPHNVFWQVGSSATLGTATAFQGNIIANTSVTATTGASVLGSLIALNGAVTLDDNLITAQPTPPPPVLPFLTLLKTNTTSPFIVGQTETFTLTVGNIGTVPTTLGSTITVTDTLPIGLTPVSGVGTGWEISIAGQTFTATTTTQIPALGVAPSITLTVLVGSAAVPSITNTATATGGGATNTATAVDTVLVIAAVPTVPILTITKTNSPSSFTVGQSGTYTVQVGNSGLSASTSGIITVTDVLPNGLTLVSGSLAGSGWTFTATGQTITATTSAVIPPGGTAPPITFEVSVGSAAVPFVTNVATASGGGATNTAVVSDITPVIPIVPILTITKTSSSSTFVVDQMGTYTLTVGNSGSASTSGTITVTDVLPSSLTFVPGSLIGTGWTFTVTGQTITATTIATVSPTETLPPISFMVTVGSTAAPSVTNTGSAFGGGALNTALASDTTPVSTPLPPPPPPSPPSPPRCFRGIAIENKFATQADYINRLKWKAGKNSSTTHVVSYLLYRNGKLIARIPAKSPHEYDDHNRHPHKKYVYKLVAIGSNDLRSNPVKTTVSTKRARTSSFSSGLSCQKSISLEP